MDTVHSPSQILGSWKEIAAYLGKGVRTVQRWESLHGLPVRRPKGAQRGVVYASRGELDRWLQNQWKQRNYEVTAGEDGAVKISTTDLILSSMVLRHANRELLASVAHTMQSLQQQCAQLAVTAAQSRHLRTQMSPPPGF
jgi:hypothetical protein